jgi:high-affinity nickel-transport protein
VDTIAAAVSHEGVTVGVALTAFLFGLRHGFDLDHLAAITDITGSTPAPRRSVFLSTLYACGHALVVLGLGMAAIVAGARIPAALDSAMGYVVGATLVALGVYVFYSIVRYGRDMRMQSRWMLVLSGLRRTWRWLRRLDHGRGELVEIEHEHEHDSSGHHDHGGIPEGLPGTSATALAVRTRTHRHAHRHVAPIPPDPFTGYGPATAFGIGMVHGVGAETPTQVLLFLTAAGISGNAGGVVLLVTFLAGLFASNTLVALGSALGFLGSQRRSWLFVILASVTGAFSLWVGVSYLLGVTPALP